MINKRLAILMAGQKKQTGDPMVGKWEFTNFNNTYVAGTGFVIPKDVVPSGNYYFENNGEFIDHNLTLQKLGGFRSTGTKILFTTNPYGLATSYTLAETSVGQRYIEFDQKTVDYIRSLSLQLYNIILIALAMTHTKQ